MVTQSSEQLIEMHKAALETLQAVAMKSVEGFEKLVELNLQAAKAQLEGQVAGQQEELQGQAEGLAERLSS